MQLFSLMWQVCNEIYVHTYVRTYVCTSVAFAVFLLNIEQLFMLPVHTYTPSTAGGFVAIVSCSTYIQDDSAYYQLGLYVQHNCKEEFTYICTYMLRLGHTFLF